MFESLTFPLFLQEFLKGQIVVSVTNVKKMKKNGDFLCVTASLDLAKASKVKSFEKMALLIKVIYRQHRIKNYIRVGNMT